MKIDTKVFGQAKTFLANSPAEIKFLAGICTGAVTLGAYSCMIHVMYNPDIRLSPYSRRDALHNTNVDTTVGDKWMHTGMGTIFTYKMTPSVYQDLTRHQHDLSEDKTKNMI